MVKQFTIYNGKSSKVLCFQIPTVTLPGSYHKVRLKCWEYDSSKSNYCWLPCCSPGRGDFLLSIMFSNWSTYAQNSQNIQPTFNLYLPSSACLLLIDALNFHSSIAFNPKKQPSYLQNPWNWGTNIHPPSEYTKAL